jgi:hypothetical protein
VKTATEYDAVSNRMYVRMLVDQRGWTEQIKYEALYRIELDRDRTRRDAIARRES